MSYSGMVAMIVWALKFLEIADTLEDFGEACGSAVWEWPDPPPPVPYNWRSVRAWSL